MDFIIESRNGLLWVTAIGQASLNKAVVAINSLVDAAIERETNLILVDCSAVIGALSVLDQYHLGSVGAEYAQQKSKALKLAVVGTPPVIDEFAAIVASNRGITAKVFRDTTDAVAWLRLSQEAQAASMMTEAKRRGPGARIGRGMGRRSVAPASLILSGHPLQGRRGFEKVLDHHDVHLAVAHNFCHTLHGIKIHYRSGGQVLHYRRLVLTDYDYGFDELRDHGQISIDNAKLRAALITRSKLWKCVECVREYPD